MSERIKTFMSKKKNQIMLATPAVSAMMAVPAFCADGDPTIQSYLAGVATVFEWILSQLTVLITFIFGNPFLAVSLYLFMAGAVIAFFIRIKNA